MGREIIARVTIVLSILCNTSVLLGGGLWVSPNSFDIEMVEGTTLTETLTVGNDSNENLSFNLRSRETSREIFEGLSDGGNVVSTTEADEGSIVIEYGFSKPVISEGGDYDTVRIEGLEMYQRIGAPIVPVRPAAILVPFGKTVVSTRVTALDKHELPGTYQLPPGQEPYPLSYEGTLVQTEPNPAVYEQETPWPGIDHEEIATHSKRGYQLFVLNLFPVQYVPATGKIIYTTRMRLEIELGDSAVAGVLRPSANTASDLRKRVDNPNFLGSYDGETMPLEKLDEEAALPGGGPYQYVIITNQALEGASGPWNFQALRDAKIAYGMTATIVTTEWIYSNYSGTRPDGGSDNQTRIRNFLIDAYQTWGTEYVLLGGTNGIVPARKFWVRAYSGGPTDTMPVDMYYGCVDPQECTFDYDADGQYGEPTDGIGGGDVDLYAEIYVGRAAVENATELENFIRKTLTYNSVYSDYLSLISMVGEYLGFGGPAQYAKNSMEQIRLGGDYDGYFTYGFENHTQPDFYDFDTSTNLYDADGTWPKSELIGLMNEGVHVLNHLGHANYTYDMKLYTSDLSSLTNTDYFFAYSQGCMPGGFDTSNCFAEVITTMEHGAFAVVMNARYGWGKHNSTDGPSQRFDRQFWDAVLDEDMLELGRANQDSKEDNLWDINGGCIRWCYYELNLFGDPQQEIKFREACEWLTLEPEEGTIGPAESNNVSVTFDAIKLAPGLYEAEIVIVSNDPCGPVIVPVTLTVNPDDLIVTPAVGFDSSGTQGGPFEPQCLTYTLTNNDDAQSVSWTVWQTESWLTVEPNHGLIDPCDSVEVSVCISADADLLDPNIYTETLTFQNTDSDSIKSRQISLTIKPPDYFSELFDDGSDLDGLMLTFIPDGSIAYYEACRQRVDRFPTDPNGGVFVLLWDDDYYEISGSGMISIPFYGQIYGRFYIGSNGYVTFGQGDTEYEPSLESHFNTPRISGMFTDLTPQDDQCISYKLLEDRAAVTFEDVQLFGDKNTKNSFQIEIFYTDGAIRITWLDIEDVDFVAGLSQGKGLPPAFFEMSDLSGYPPCWPWCDFDRDYMVNFADYALFALNWLEQDCGIPYWCGKSDLDLSGMVSEDDISVFAEDWLMVEDWFLQPIAHWKFDEGTGDIAHDSAGDNDGNLIGDTAWVIGKIGDYALEFDGDGDYVETSEDFVVTGSEITISMWVYFRNNSSQSSTLVSHHDLTPNYGYEPWITNSDNHIWFRTSPDGTTWYDTDTGIVITENTWTHLGFAVNSTGRFLYLNGSPVWSDGNGGIHYPSNRKLGIGVRTYNSAYDQHFNGTIDDVRIYDRVLSAEEIEELYREGMGSKAYNPHPADGATVVDPNTILSWSPGKDAVSHDVYLGTDFNDVNDANTSSPQFMGNFDVNSFDPCGLELKTTYYWRIDEHDDSNTYKGDVWSFTTWAAPNLASWWKFDEGSGGTAYDSAGNVDGTIHGAQWVDGVMGKALQFDGYDNYVSLPTTVINGTEFTVTAWANHLGTGGGTFTENPIFQQKDRGISSLVSLFAERKTLSKVAAMIRSHTGGENEQILYCPMSAHNEWHHYVMTVDANDFILYMDGQEVASTTNNQTGNYTTSIDYIQIARSSYLDTHQGYFNGIIDDVRIYDRALSAGEIEELYQEGMGNKAFDPNPADGATDIDPNVILSWSPGKDAVSHDVYLGTDFNDVNDANTSSPQFMGNFDVNSFDPCGLELYTTYYWRIDEHDDSNTYKGDIWSFTTWAVSNLASWWKFDEGQGSTAYDSAGNVDGTIHGAQWVDGVMGKALQFDGYDNYVSLPTTVINGTEFTVTAWANHLGTGGGTFSENPIFQQKDRGISSFVALFAERKTSSKIAAVIRSHTGGENEQILYYPMSAHNEWHHYVMTVDANDFILYMDGQEVASTTNNQTGNYTTSIDYIQIARSSYLSTHQGYFNGIIDDVRIYDRTLSAEEIEDIYREGLNKAFNPSPEDGATGVDPNVILSWSPGKDAISHDLYLGTDFNDVNDANTSSAEFMGNFDVSSFDPCGLELETTYYWRIDEHDDSNIYKGDVWSFTTFDVNLGLVSWWQFNEGSGSIAYDSAGNNNGTLVGDPCWVTGKIGSYALGFDGTNDYVEVDDDSRLEGMDSLAISAWIKPRQNSGQDNVIIVDKDCDTAYRFHIYDADQDDGKARLTAWINGINGTPPDIIEIDMLGDTWCHVVLVYSNFDDELRYYVDGSLAGTRMMISGAIGTNSYPLRIGRSTASQYFKGTVDDVRIYDRALSEGEIQQLYQQGL